MMAAGFENVLVPQGVGVGVAVGVGVGGVGVGVGVGLVGGVGLGHPAPPPVAMVRSHPPAKVWKSPAASSKT